MDEDPGASGSWPWSTNFSEVFIGAMGVSVLALIFRFLIHELRQMQVSTAEMLDDVSRYIL